eukprot:TRINITY_DN3853_c0_g1_i1.p1 TRINITY_DN3853_c0_g1~~TRINITY_DN3853_c0_g1_i1.p1  ORF type:complete len:393 (-),score=59.59 TRINITY_DN3853_c0_g1_i1:76-1170(-)
MAPKAPKAMSRDVEAHLARTQLVRDGKGLIPVVILSTVVSTQQLYAGSRELSFFACVFSLLGAGAALFLVRLAKVDDGKIVEAAKLAEKIIMGFRVLMHAICYSFDDGSPDAVVYRITSLFCLPVAAARSCRDRRNFIAFLVAHNLLVVVRYWSNYRDNMSWIMGSVGVQLLLLDMLKQLHDQHDMRAELSAALDRVEKVSESSVRASFDIFCDMTVQLDKHHRCDQVEPLADFLDLSELGDVCHFPGLLEGAREMVEFSRNLDELSTRVIAHAKSDASRSLWIEPSEYTFRGHTSSHPITLFPVGLIDFKGDVSFLIGMCKHWKRPADSADGQRDTKSGALGASSSEGTRGHLGRKGKSWADV